jgi:hypothetical protein
MGGSLCWQVGRTYLRLRILGHSREKLLSFFHLLLMVNHLVDKVYIPAAASLR